MDFSERLKEARIRAGMSQSQIAKCLYMTQQAYSGYEHGSFPSNPETLERLAKALNVSVDYLLDNEDFSRSFANVEPIQTKKVPLLGDIAAGKPIFVAEQYGEYAVTSEDVDCDFCLRVRGDSMIGARINDGDIVFIHEQPTVENGEIAAVAIDDFGESEATLKRVYYYPEQGKMILSPENPAFAPLVYVGSELDRVRILGKAVAFQSLVR